MAILPVVPVFTTVVVVVPPTVIVLARVKDCLIRAIFDHVTIHRFLRFKYEDFLVKVVLAA